MAKMTRYRRPGIQVAQPQSIDFAGLREAKRMGTVISQQVSQMQGFLERQAQQEAEFKAGEIIREKGAVAATELMEAGGPKTYMEQQIFKSGMRIAAQELETNAIGEINRTLLEAETNHLTPKQLNDRLRDISDGFPAALADVDGETASLLQSKLQGRIGEAQNKYMGIHSKWIQSQEQGRALLGLQARQDAALDAISLPGDKQLRDAAFEAHLADAAQFMRDKNFDETEISKWLIEARQKGIIDSNLADFSRLGSTDEKISYLEKLEKNPPKGLTRNKTRTLIKALRADMANTQKLYKSETTAIDSGIKELNKVLTKGGRPSDEDIGKLKLRVDALPAEVKGTLGQEIINLETKRDYINYQRKLSPAELQAEVNELSAGLKNMGGDGIDTLLEAEIVENANKLLTEMNTQVKTDPLSWAQQVGHAKVEPLRFDDVQAGLAGDADAMQRAQQSFETRMQTAKTVHGLLGGPLKYLTNEEANLLSNMYAEAQSTTRLGLLHSVNKFFKGEARNVFEQIAQTDPQMGYLGGLIDLGMPDNAMIALKGFDRLDEKVVMDFDDTMAKTDYRSQVGGSFAFDAAADSATFEVAKAIYAELSNKRNIDAYDTGLWEESVNMAVGYNPKNGTGGFAEVRDAITILPPGIDDDQMETMLEEITAEKIKAMSDQDVSAENMTAIRENDDVFLIPIHDGVYVPYIRQSNGDPAPLVAQDGSRIEIDVYKYQGLK